MTDDNKKTNAKKALLLLFAVNLLNFFDRQLPGVLGEPIRKEFGLTDAQLGLIGTAFTLVYAAVGLPIGRLADTWVRTRLISIGVTVWSAAHRGVGRRDQLRAASSRRGSAWALARPRVRPRASP